MATARPFSFNTGSTITGSTQVGDLGIGVEALPWCNQIGGVTWYMGCDEDLGYVIALPVPSLHQPTFFRTPGFTDQLFIDLCNYLSREESGPVFTTVNEAYDWLTIQGYWTSYGAPPSPTPSPTLTPTPSITPTLTPTPTPTPSERAWTGTGFTTEWVTTVTGTTITLPLYNSGTFNATVDWGDGSPESTITTYFDTDKSHVYDEAGTYQIEIKGECPGWSFGNGGGTADKIKKVLHWGESTAFGGFQYLTRGFYGASNITSIAGGGSILTKAGLTSLESLFEGLSYITTISAGLFDNCTNVTSFEEVFFWCPNLTTIPAGLFSGATSATTFEGAFQYADLSSIPPGLFDNNTSVTTFTDTFRNNSNITTIPTGLFDNNTLVTSFANTFMDTSITAIPAGLFSGNTSVTNFGNTFNGTDISSIPSGLFDNNTSVTNFGVTFRYCDNLTSIPSGLFDFNTGVTSFAWTFGDCGLTGVTANLFDNNKAVTSFRETFRSMTSLVSVPVEIFQYNTGVTSFRQTFTNCYNLALTPNGMFTGHTLATDFYGLFYRGYNVQLHENMFDEDGLSGSTRFFNQSINWSYAFSIGDSAYQGSVGTAPELWDYNYGSGTPTTLDAFRDRDSSGCLTNYDDIPPSWL